MTWPAFVANWIVNDYQAILRRGATPYHRDAYRSLAVTGLLERWYRGEMDSHEARRLLRAVVEGEADWLWT